MYRVVRLDVWGAGDERHSRSRYLIETTTTHKHMQLDAVSGFRTFIVSDRFQYAQY